jgi:hypothetical protein
VWEVIAPRAHCPPPCALAPLLQALRFGASRAQLEEGLALAFSLSPVAKEAAHAASLQSVAMASRGRQRGRHACARGSALQQVTVVGG